MASKAIWRLSGPYAVGLAALLAQTVLAHEHHDDKIPEGAAVSPDPLDTILWVHIFIQITAWGILYPTGMVLGLVRSRWHVPVQILASCLAIVGHFLGHKHGGRQFKHNVHSSFAPWLEFFVVCQVGLGVYLKLHVERGFLRHLSYVRRVLVICHGIAGKILPVAAWVQMLFGGITALGFCRGDHLGQCLAHFIMGSAFIGYGIVLTIMLLVGQAWLRRSGRSQEFFDSMIIAAWGCVNTFTEHRWGGPWVRNDLQHTSMGIVWWCAGLLGIWLSRRRDGTPKRNLIPGIVILLTGYAMSAHPQELMLSTMIHTFFGYTLMAAGLTRIIEIAFILRDKPCVSEDGNDPNSFQYLPTFLLYASGFLFMGATEEQMALLAGAHVTHVSYILILYSIAFMMFLFVNLLLHIYATCTMPSKDASDTLGGRRGHSRLESVDLTDDIVHEPYKEDFDIGNDEDEEDETAHRVGGKPNGGPAAINTNTLSDGERHKIKSAQEYELDALISEGESEGSSSRLGKKKESNQDGSDESVRLI